MIVYYAVRAERLYISEANFILKGLSRAILEHAQIKRASCGDVLKNSLSQAGKILQLDLNGITMLQETVESTVCPQQSWPHLVID